MKQPVPVNKKLEAAHTGCETIFPTREGMWSNTATWRLPDIGETSLLNTERNEWINCHMM